MNRVTTARAIPAPNPMAQAAGGSPCRNCRSPRNPATTNPARTDGNQRTAPQSCRRSNRTVESAPCLAPMGPKRPYPWTATAATLEGSVSSASSGNCKLAPRRHGDPMVGDGPEPLQ